jgi:hypothetical protein
MRRPPAMVIAVGAVCLIPNEKACRPNPTRRMTMRLLVGEQNPYPIAPSSMATANVVKTRENASTPMVPEQTRHPVRAERRHPVRSASPRWRRSVDPDVA